MNSSSSYPRTIENGAGETLIFLGVESTPEGERINITGSARPGAGPPMHVHYLQDEVVRVETGRVGYQLLGQEAKFAGPGETVAWPAGTAHRWWNAVDTPPKHISGKYEIKLNGNLLEGTFLAKRHNRKHPPAIMHVATSS